MPTTKQWCLILVPSILLACGTEVASSEEPAAEQRADALGPVQPPPEPPPACDVKISATPTPRVYAVNWGSNGTSCGWYLNDVYQGSVACSGSATLTLAPGYNKLRLYVKPQAISCSAAVTVN